MPGRSLPTSRFVASRADRTCSSAGTQVASSSLLAQSSVKSSLLLHAWELAADVFVSACFRIAAMCFLCLPSITCVFTN